MSLKRHSFGPNLTLIRAALVLACLVAVLTAAPGFGPAAQAQDSANDPPANMVAVVDNKGRVHVSWDVTSDTSWYAIKWNTVANPTTDQFLRDRIRREGTEGARWTFDPTQSRATFVIPGSEATPILSVFMKDSPAGNAEASPWSTNPVRVNDGLPTQFGITRSGNDVTASWTPNNSVSPLTVKKYVLVYRPDGDTSQVVSVDVEQTNGIATTTHRLSDLPGNYEFRLRTVYTDGFRVDSGWIDDVSSVPSDLTDECRQGGGVHSAIGAQGEYNELRIPLETQVWFFPTEADAGGLDTGRSLGHAHLLTCVPHRAVEHSEVTDQVLALDFQIVAHLQSAVRLDDTQLDATEDIEVRIDQFEIRGRNGSGKDILVDRHFLATPLICTSTQGQCVFTQQIDVSLFDSPRTGAKRGFITNGPKEVRLAAVHEIFDVADGEDEHIASVRSIMRVPFEIDIDNHGAPLNPNFIPRITESSGWLIEDDQDGAGGYATIGISKFDGNRGMLPVAAISRSESPELNLTLHVEADPCRLNCIVDRMPVTRYWAFLNPGFHGDSVCAADAPMTCRQALMSEPLEIPPPHPSPNAPEDIPRTSHPVTIDISDLEPGVHRLVLAVEQPMVNGRNGQSRKSDGFETNVVIDDERFESTLTGLLVVRFIVTE